MNDDATSWLFDAPGPRAKRRIRVLSALGVVVLALVVWWVWHELSLHGQLDGPIWQTATQSAVLTSIGRGLLATIRAAAMALLLSVALGGLLAWMRLSGSRVAGAVARVWTELFRGVPTLLSIFFMYLGLPALGVPVSIFWAMVLGVTLYSGALYAEIFRAGVNAVPAGQRDAGRALGISRVQVFISVVGPQAFRWTLPLLVSQTVMLVKETSLGFVIGYTELLRTGQLDVQFLGSSYSLPIYTLVCVTYILLNLVLSAVARVIERRTRRQPRLRGAAAPADVALQDVVQASS
jgi:glutamate transport system permease protein